MAYTGEYRCSRCNKIEKQERLTAKKIMFVEVGVKPQVFKSRIVDWLCPSCTVNDPDWHRPAYSSPGSRQ